MGADRIIKFEPNGPGGSGLKKWFDIDPAGLEAGTPVQHVHLYHEDGAKGYMTGVWDCTAMTAKAGPYDVHEFMLLLEGSLTMVLPDGTEVPVKAGEAFVLPKGLQCQWKQEEYVRKFFMILEDPGAPIAEDVASQGVILPTAAGPASGLTPLEIDDPSGYVGDLPVQHEHIYFEDPSKQMQVGLWQSTPFETTPGAFPYNEMMCLLEGSVTITDGEGHEHHFKAGDTIYVPKGAVCGWKNTENVRKFFAIYDPSSDKA